jgi:saccharopepsin
MAYPALARKGVKPIFDTVMDQNLLQANMFAFYLTTKAQESAGYNSDLTLGYYDKQKFTGDIHWNDIKLKYMFGVKMDDILINGKSYDVCKNRECLITFDSGTTEMSIPKFAENILAQSGVPTSDMIKPCKNA